LKNAKQKSISINIPWIGEATLSGNIELYQKLGTLQ
jgi:hypothetical protein